MHNRRGGREPVGCLILTGTPGAGKTTVSELVAQRFSRAARISGDSVAAMIVRGAVGPVSEPAEEAEHLLRLRATNVCSVANNFAAAGFVPVVDHVVADRSTLEHMLGVLEPRPVHLVVLAPPLRVCQDRNSTRGNGDRVDYDFSQLCWAMRQELSDVGWWLDTADLDPDATAARIVAEAHGRAAVPMLNSNRP